MTDAKPASTSAQPPPQAEPSAPPRMSAESPAWRPQVMVALITLVCLVPFLNKAYHMDDTLFLWAARHIREHAANFYGFNANWYGYAMPMHQIMQNPPGGAYFVAGAAALGGWRELWLHSVFLLPAIAAALGTFRLARRLSSRPAVGALCAVLTPAFMVSATNLMADVLMLACYTWAIAFWVEGLEDRHTGRLIISSLLIAAAALTKYFGLSLLPLLGAYAWFYHRKQAGMAMAWLLLPLAVLWLYETYSSRLYGQGLIFGALDYSAMVAVMNAAPLQRLGTGLSFLGGGLIGTILFIPWLWPRRRWILGAGIYLLLALAAVTLLGKLVIAQGKWMEQAGSCFRAQYILFVGGGLHLVLLAASEFRARRDGHSFLLLCWFLGTFAFAAALNWTVSVRSLLPLAPAAGILIARRLGRLPPAAGQPPGLGTVSALLGACALVSCAVAWADYAWAGSSRAMARKLYSAYKEPANTVYYQGHWGFQYYMDAVGGVAVDPQATVLRSGDIIISPWDNTNVETLNEAIATRKAIYPSAPRRWLSVGNGFAGASFYSSTWGPLPWFVGPAPQIAYEIFRVR